MGVEGQQMSTGMAVVAKQEWRQKSEARTQLVTPPVWEREQYARITSGRHLVRVVKLQGPEWVRAFRRWSLRLECVVVEDGALLSAFFNLGGTPDAPSMPGRQSKYFRAWTMANGEAPRKGQPLDWNIFLDKFFTAEVADCSKDSKDREKSEGEIYSKITDFLRFEGP
jgi:hypothetical protein